MRYLTLSILAVFVISTIPFVLPYELTDADFTVPSWIKNNAGWWADDLIGDDSFVSGIEWLVTNDVFVLPQIEQGTSDGENVVPRWIKSTAGWWAEDKINDVTFVSAIKYLINEGIIVVQQVEEVKEAEESVEEIVEMKEFHMVVNGHSCDNCVSWAYVGKEYSFQIETFDEYRGNPIDDVTITAKIISQYDELRHDFGVITTEDGIYRNTITIPNMDWYAENILSITAEYNGIEKTIEDEFEVFHSHSRSSGVTMAGAGDCANVTPVSLATENAKPQGLAFSSDGTKMYTTGNPGSADKVWYYTLTGAYCIATAQFAGAVNVESIDSTPTGIAFNPNGEMMFMTGKGSNPGDVYRFDLSARYLPTSANMTHFQNYQITEDNSPEDIHLNPTGTEMFIVGSAADQVHQYSMQQPFALSNASHTFTLDITSQESSPSGIHINPTGTKMFIVGAGGKEVNEYTMNVPFTLSSASHTHAFSVSSQENNPRAIWFDNTGRKMFIIGFTGDDVNVYKMIPGFNLYNATFVDGSKLS